MNPIRYSRGKILWSALWGGLQLLVDVVALIRHRPRQPRVLGHMVAVRVLARCAEAEVAQRALFLVAPGPVFVWTEIDSTLSQGRLVVVVERERDSMCRTAEFDLKLFEPPAEEDPEHLVSPRVERQLEQLFA